MSKTAYARPKSMRKTVRQFARYLGRHFWLLLIVGFLVIVPAVATLIGTYAIKTTVNIVVETGDLHQLGMLCLEIGGMYLLGALSTFGYTQITAILAQKVTYEMRRDLIDRMNDLPIRYFDQHSFGNIMSIFTNDVEAVSDALNNAFATLIQYAVEILGTLILIFVLSPSLSLIVFAFYILMFVYIIFSSKKSKKYYNKQQTTLGELTGYADEMIRGLRTVKAFNHEPVAMRTFNDKSAELEKSARSAMSYASSMVPMVMALSYVNYGIVTIVGGLYVIGGGMSLGTIASYLVFVRQTAMPINRLTSQANLLLNGLAAAERIFGLLNEVPEVDEGTVRLEKEGEGYAWVDGKKRVPLRGDIRFHDVTFSYVPGHPVLQNLSLYAKPGQKIAFVGSTGAGKTTITNLINRFYDIDEGSITFDGIDVRSIQKNALRNVLGMVLQDTHLFSGTIEDNIRFGKLDATHEEVVKAAQLANADSFIRRMPQGYQTYLSADGSNLSQGQRQLLAIARAAISDPPVLILDEATSSVDTHTEKLIQDGMDKLMKGRTVFAIAHRLSTVRNANAIIVLEHGAIIERGDHDVLLAQKGRYYELYTGKSELS